VPSCTMRPASITSTRSPRATAAVWCATSRIVAAAAHAPDDGKREARTERAGGMREHAEGRGARQLAERAVDGGERGVVERGGGLIEQDDARALHHRSRQAEQLALACGRSGEIRGEITADHGRSREVVESRVAGALRLR
jgi:hypothetical protein